MCQKVQDPLDIVNKPPLSKIEKNQHFSNLTNHKIRNKSLKNMNYSCHSDGPKNQQTELTIKSSSPHYHRR